MNAPAATLHIKKLENFYLLQGYVQEGDKRTQIRRRSKDLGELTALKEQHEAAALLGQANLASRVARPTWLSPEQLDEAESVFKRLPKGRSLLATVLAGLSVTQEIQDKACWEALAIWLARQDQASKAAHTLRNNRTRVTRFFLANGLAQRKTVQEEVQGKLVEKVILTGTKMVSEITPEMCRNFIEVRGTPLNTQLSNARPLRAFLNFCVKEGFLRSSPCKVDMKDVKQRARAVLEPKILSAAQAQALLTAAAQVGLPRNAGEGKFETIPGTEGIMLPFVILSAWCFLRVNEINGNEQVKGITPSQLAVEDGKLVIRCQGHKKGSASKRKVSVPQNVRPLLEECVKRGLWVKDQAAYFNRSLFDHIRVQAGLLTLGEYQGRGTRREYVENEWQPNILRHTGISYLYEVTRNIQEVCRQAGNTSDVAFKHYLQLLPPEEAAAFYKATATLPNVHPMKEVAA